jgi:outer membrane protein TolC
VVALFFSWLAPAAFAVDFGIQRCLNGRSSYLEVLQAQQELDRTQRVQVQMQVDELIAIIQICKALGGCWQTSPR